MHFSSLLKTSASCIQLLTLPMKLLCQSSPLKHAVFLHHIHFLCIVVKLPLQLAMQPKEVIKTEMKMLWLTQRPSPGFA